MKVHLRQIPSGGTLHLAGEEDPSGLDLADAGAEPAGPLRYALEVGLSDGGIFATGELRLRVRMRCVVTLEHFETEIVIPTFAMQRELDGRELVDLTPEVREDIHLALPAHPRSDAVKDSNPFAPSADPVVSPAEPEGPSPWEALDRLKSKN